MRNEPEQQPPAEIEEESEEVASDNPDRLSEPEDGPIVNQECEDDQENHDGNIDVPVGDPEEEEEEQGGINAEAAERQDEPQRRRRARRRTAEIFLAEDDCAIINQRLRQDKDRDGVRSQASKPEADVPIGDPVPQEEEQEEQGGNNHEAAERREEEPQRRRRARRRTAEIFLAEDGGAMINQRLRQDRRGVRPQGPEPEAFKEVVAMVVRRRRHLTEVKRLDNPVVKSTCTRSGQI